MRRNQYSSEKRRKELDRKKKQEEKRQKKLDRRNQKGDGTDEAPLEAPLPGSPEAQQDEGGLAPSETAEAEPPAGDARSEGPQERQG